MDENMEKVVESLKEEANQGLPDLDGSPKEESKVIDASEAFTNNEANEVKIPMDDLKPDFQSINNNYINSVASHASSEVETLERLARTDSNVAAALAYDARTIIMQMLAMGAIRVRGEHSDAGTLQNVIERYYSMIGALLQGQNLAAITGDESEWVDIDVEEGSEKALRVKFRGKTYEIKYDTVQANIRCPGLFRFNGDNQFAHVTNFYKFHDINNPMNVYSTAMSRRFITFPYYGETYDADVELDENGEVSRYVGISDYALTSKILYPRGDSCFIASPIPVYMLEQVGVDIDEEIKNFNKDEK